MTYVNVTKGKQSPSDAFSASRKQKNRLTFFCRHSISGVFDPDEAMPKGHIDSSVILVPAAKPARLEDMSFYEPSVWLRDHSFILDGNLIVRKKGEPVGLLGSDWRNTRQRQKYWFYHGCTDFKLPPERWQPGPVRVWFQEKATEDTIIALA